MRFGPLPVGEAEGALLAHSVSAGKARWRKAHRLCAEDIEAMRAEGIETVIAAVLGPGDVEEDMAATRLAKALRTLHVTARTASTGRVNLHADMAGLFCVDKAMIDAVNAIDPTLTVATLGDKECVEAGQMVATVKVIPFAVDGAVLEAAERQAAQSRAFEVLPFASRRIGLIQTELAGLKPSVLDKTARITADRLQRSQSVIVDERRVAHDAGAIREALQDLLARCDMLIVFGASAMSDPGDVIPAAIELAGGTVERVGMPVDPGNLLVLGALDGRPVIGAPGCARSPKVNGFDWVLDRLLAGMAVTRDDIAMMGVGGLLTEIPSRPQPREKPAARRPRLGAVLLAAGSARRMGGPNKLLARFDGQPLIRRVGQHLLAAGLTRIVAVTGRDARKIGEALDGLEFDIVHNDDHESGLAGSLKAGIAALRGMDGVLVMLGDMPDVSPDHLANLVEAFSEAKGRAVIRATADGEPGNPVILPKRLFDAVAGLEGDKGARLLIEESGLDILDVEIGEAALVDVDTPEALARAGGSLA